MVKHSPKVLASEEKATTITIPPPIPQSNVTKLRGYVGTATVGQGILLFLFSPHCVSRGLRSCPKGVHVIICVGNLEEL